MGVCSRCGGTVQDQNLQPDAEGKLVCRTCAGAWRAKSGQMSANPGRQESGPGFWMPLALATSALCVLLLIIAIALGAGKSAAKKDKETLEGQLRTARSNLTAKESELADANRDKATLKYDLDDLRKQSEATAKELAELKAGGKKPPKLPGPGPITPGPGPIIPGPGPGPGPIIPGPGLPTDKVYINATKATLYHAKGCRFLHPGFKTLTLEDAKKKKLNPCKTCNPPQ